MNFKDKTGLARNYICQGISLLVLCAPGSIGWQADSANSSSYFRRVGEYLKKGIQSEEAHIQEIKSQQSASQLEFHLTSEKQQG